MHEIVWRRALAVPLVDSAVVYEIRTPFLRTLRCVLSLCVRSPYSIALPVFVSLLLLVRRSTRLGSHLHNSRGGPSSPRTVAQRLPWASAEIFYDFGLLPLGAKSWRLRLVAAIAAGTGSSAWGRRFIARSRPVLGQVNDSVSYIEDSGKPSERRAKRVRDEVLPNLELNLSLLLASFLGLTDTPDIV